MRQIHCFFNAAKTQSILCWFTFFVQFVYSKLFLFWFTELAEQFQLHNLHTKHVLINKESVVRFWLNWRSYGSVSYYFIFNTNLHIFIRWIWVYYYCPGFELFADAFAITFSQLFFCSLLFWPLNLIYMDSNKRVVEKHFNDEI